MTMARGQIKGRFSEHSMTMMPVQCLQLHGKFSLSSAEARNIEFWWQFWGVVASFYGGPVVVSASGSTKAAFLHS